MLNGISRHIDAYCSCMFMAYLKKVVHKISVFNASPLPGSRWLVVRSSETLSSKTCLCSVGQSRRTRVRRAVAEPL